MRRYLIPGMILTALCASQARADFVMAPPPAVSPQPSAAETKLEVAKSGNPAAPPGPQFSIAQGFGDHVPLRFAVRQIVPPTVKVTYGPGADPNAAVNWKGGEGWNRVLLHAVQPLGLRLVPTDMAVEIRK